MNQTPYAPPAGPGAPVDASAYTQPGYQAPAASYAPPAGMPGMPPAGPGAPVDASAYAQPGYQAPAASYAPPAGPGAPVDASAYTQPGYQAPAASYAPPAGMPGTMPANAPQSGGYQQNGNRSQKINKHVGKVTHTGNQLFEISGAVDITDKFPDGIGFVMLVPSIQDNTKKSGRSYVMNDKIVIKFSTEELHSLSEALKEAGRWGRCSFIKFSDPKKADSSSTAETKKFSVTAIVEGENIKVFMSLTWGQKKISMPLTKYAALGLANQIGDLASAINQAKFEIDRTLVTQ